MKKNILIVLSASLFTIAGQADVGSGVILKCGKTFSINKTAVPNLFQGQLRVGQNDYSLNCKPVDEEPSNVVKLWDCSEDRAGEGKFLVNVQTGGFAGTIKTAYVEQEQMFPLEPMHVATLTCK
ncbi:MAG: hypothetical protein ACXVLQ_15965 [Bacteriovorax sp.]